MSAFTSQEIDDIDALWRSVSADHVWTGWAAAGESPSEILIFRTRAHWRKFPLRKTGKGYALFDERDRCVAEEISLSSLLEAVEAIPGLGDTASSPQT